MRLDRLMRSMFIGVNYLCFHAKRDELMLRDLAHAPAGLGKYRRSEGEIGGSSGGFLVLEESDILRVSYNSRLFSRTSRQKLEDHDREGYNLQ